MNSPTPGKLAKRVRLITCFAVTLSLLLLAAWFSLRLVPLPRALFVPPPAQQEFTDRNGLPLRNVRPAGSAYLKLATYSEIPQALIHATLAAEDKRFWSHPGMDIRASLRAGWGLLWHRRVVSGGSTITQQLIKQVQPRPRTFRTKIIEALQALRLEQVWDKQRILAEYLNRIDYGNLNTGCAAAAEFYFGKSLRDLSAAECALLAGLPQTPSRLNPLKHPERARKRQQWVLRRMRLQGFLTAEEFARATAESLRLNPHRPFEAPHFVDLLLQSGKDAWNKIPTRRDRVPNQNPQEPNTFNQPSTNPHFAHCPPHSALSTLPSATSLDLELNRFTEQAIRRQIARLTPQHVGDAAAVVIDNRSGGVLALVGSGDYFSLSSGQVNGAWAPRSAGSTFKPFTYLIAFEQGATPATIVADVPTEFATPTGLFSPVNYDRRCHGPMRYRLALANSLNIAAVKVLASIGGPAVLQERLKACGLTTLSHPAEHYGLGLTIGNAEARLLELANAYATLARLGEYRPYTLLQQDSPQPPDGRPQKPSTFDLLPALDPRFSTLDFIGRSQRPSDFGLRTSDFFRVSDFGLRISPPSSLPSHQVFNPSACFLLADILSDNAARALAFGAESNLRFDFPVACKTGTSSDFRDNWAFGYTPEFTVGVWVGNADGSPMQGISGVTGAAPILHDLMEHLHQRYGTSWYATPTNVVELAVHPVTGKRLPTPSSRSSAAAVLEKFIASQLPPESDPADFDSQGRIRLPAEYRDWLLTSDNWLSGQAVVADSSRALRIVFPLPGTILYLDPDLPESGRRIRLRSEGAAEPRWRSDTLQCRAESGQTFAFLTPGRHRLTLSDPRTGLQRETWVQVFER